jgi:hypothetical protein
MAQGTACNLAERLSHCSGVHRCPVDRIAFTGCFAELDLPRPECVRTPRAQISIHGGTGNTKTFAGTNQVTSAGGTFILGGWGPPSLRLPRRKVPKPSLGNKSKLSLTGSCAVHYLSVPNGCPAFFGLQWKMPWQILDRR